MPDAQVTRQGSLIRAPGETRRHRRSWPLRRLLESWHESSGIESADDDANLRGASYGHVRTCRCKTDCGDHLGKAVRVLDVG